MNPSLNFSRYTVSFTIEEDGVVLVYMAEYVSPGESVEEAVSRLMSRVREDFS